MPASVRRVRRRSSICSGREVRGDDRRQARVEAMVDDLEQLLLRPRRRATACRGRRGRARARCGRARTARRSRHLGVGLVGGAQVVEQVRHDDEQRRLAALEHAVDDGGGDVRLAAAAGAGEHEPAVGRLGEGARVVDAAAVLLLRARVGAAAAGDEVRERQPRQRADVRVARRRSARLALVLRPPAQRHGTTVPEVRVVERHVAAHEARAVAVAGTRRRRRRRSAAGSASGARPLRA